jgi:hypothetical protein
MTVFVQQACAQMPQYRVIQQDQELLQKDVQDPLVQQVERTIRIGMLFKQQLQEFLTLQLPQQLERMIMTSLYLDLIQRAVH